MDQILDLPFEVAIVALFAVVMARVNATYWIGRGAAAGMERTRFGVWAFVYATTGLAAIEAWLAVMAASPLAAVILPLFLAGLAVCLIMRRRRRTAVAPEDTVV